MRRRVLLSQALALLLLAGAPDVAHAAARVVAAESIARDLGAGRAVVRTRVSVVGRLDLRGETVRAEFTCRSCTFGGRVSAAGVIFLQDVDMSGSTFERETDFQDASFKGSALFRDVVAASGLRERTDFRGRVDFSRATFAGLASFSGCAFSREAVFREVQLTEADFTEAAFRAAATFDRATFRRAAVFDAADFSNVASFTSTSFRDRADFVAGRFDSGAEFWSARFAQGASFRGALFTISGSFDLGGSDIDVDAAATFARVTSERDLDFTFALFRIGDAPGRKLFAAIFRDIVCRRSLVFRDTTFRGSLLFGRVDVRDLIMDVGAVTQIEERYERRAVLQKIQSDAKTRGDFGLANDAFYQLQIVKSREYRWPWRVLDFIFYRLAAGYLVRPEHPIALFVLLAFAASLFRVRRRDDNPPATVRGGIVAPLRFLQRLVDEMVGTMKDAVPHRFGGGGGTKVRGAELYAYRILLVCALIGLYAQPTLRQYLDLVT